MGLYTTKHVTDIEQNFKLHELKEILNSAEEDMAILDKLIKITKIQIANVEEKEFAPLLVLRATRERMRCNEFEILLLNAPKQMELYNNIADFQTSFPMIRKLPFLLSELNIVILCCDELIKKYSIPRERIIIDNYYTGKAKERLEMSLDNICNGKLDIQKIKKGCYKSQMYIDFRSLCNSNKEMSNRVEKSESVLIDGRPFKELSDGYQDAWYVTYTFSSEDIELYEKEDFIRLLQPQLAKHKISKNDLMQLSSSVKRDESGCRMWSVTIPID